MDSAKDVKKKHVGLKTIHKFSHMDSLVLVTSGNRNV